MFQYYDGRRFEAEAKQPPPPSATPIAAPIPPRLPPAPGTVLGKLEVPRLKLTVLVRHGTAERTLNRGAGHIEGTTLPGDEGNIGIAAHRDQHFKPLERIRVGDSVRLTIPGKVQEFRVRQVWIVGPETTNVLSANIGAALTLVTCYPFKYVGNAPKRFIVRALPEMAE